MKTPHVQTKTEIRETLDRYGVKPRKRHGQHFLIDGNLMRRLAQAAELGPGDAVLEVGAGTGGLTDLLLASAGRVIAVEVDPTMQVILRERFADQPNLGLIAGDALAGKHHVAPEVLAAIGRAAEHGLTLKLAANLPYHVATPLLANLLTDGPRPALLVFTVQKEVADRFLARPRTKEYGPLSVLFQSACDVQSLATVPPSAFWPQPEVSSTLVRCVPRRSDAERLPDLMALVHAGFAYRRKTLRYNLRKMLNDDQLERAEATCDLDRRAEELSVAEWLLLSASFDRQESAIGNPQSTKSRRV